MPSDIKTTEHEKRIEALQVPMCGISLNDHIPVHTVICSTHGGMTPTLELRLHPSAHCSIEILGYTLKRYHRDAPLMPHALPILVQSGFSA